MESPSSKPTVPLYQLNPEGLRPGDIVLERGSGSQGSAIRLADPGDYSHALLWLGPTDLIEAVKIGARVISYLRVVIDKPANWSVLRLVDNPEGAARAAIEARRLAHKPYNLKGAINTKAGFSRAPDHTSLFCSQFVAEAYARAGISLIPGTPPEKVTPGKLQAAPTLTTIETPLVLIPPDKVEDARAALDRDTFYKDSPMNRELAASRKAFLAVQAAANALPDPQQPGVPYPAGNLAELLDLLRASTHPSVGAVADQLLVQLDQSGYFHFGTEPLVALKLRVDAHRARVEAGIADAADIEEFEEWFRRAGLSETLERHRNNYAVCHATFVRTRSQLWFRLATMYVSIANALELIIRTATGTAAK